LLEKPFEKSMVEINVIPRMFKELVEKGLLKKESLLSD
jgi:hypothetical protein